MSYDTRFVATVLIPCAPVHQPILQRAIDSVKAQSIPVHCIAMIDTNGIGAGAMRNELAAQADTPFIVFLDADDTLHPKFIEQCLFAYDKKHYVYTDWNADGVPTDAPDYTLGFAEGRYHLVTTLLPRAWFNHVGGFDTGLRCMEDTDLYLKMAVKGMCGKRVPMPLVDYNVGGVRAIHCQQETVYNEINFTLNERYGDDMCNCGKNTPQNKPNNPNEPFEDSVLAVAKYSPAKMVGRVTGRVYPRTGLGAQLYVHRDDVNASPDWWERVLDPSELAPDITTVLELAARSRFARQMETPLPEVKPVSAIADTKRKRRSRKAG